MGMRSAIVHYALQNTTRVVIEHIPWPKVIPKSTDISWNKQDKKPVFEMFECERIGISLLLILVSPPVWLKLVFLDDSVRGETGKNSWDLKKEKQA